MADHEIDYRTDWSQMLVPRFYVDGDRQPVFDLETTNADDALNAAVAAERLHLSWVLASYYSAEVDGESERQFHLIAWRHLVADVGPSRHVDREESE